MKFCIGRVFDLSPLDSLFYIALGIVVGDCFFNSGKSFACSMDVGSILEEGELVVFSVVDKRVVNLIPTRRKVIGAKSNKIVFKKN